MQNKGSSTIEMSVIMAVIFMSLMLVIQCYFAALGSTREWAAETRNHSRQSCNIEQSVKRLRRWQWVDEKV